VNLRAKIGRRSFVVLVMGSVLMGALISFEGVALATATSGDVYKLTTGPYGSTYVDNCLKATITTGADNIADIYSFSDKEPSRCDGSYAYSMPGGYLGIDASGYKNGAYCGSTGYYYNSGAYVWNWCRVENLLKPIRTPNLLYGSNRRGVGLLLHILALRVHGNSRVSESELLNVTRRT